MRLNKRGYMLIEIIIASVLAFGIAYYLLNLTYKFKNTDQDIYQSIYYTTDQMLITKNIMNDLEQGEITGFELSPDKKELTFNLVINNSATDKTLRYVTRRRLKVKNNQIYYGEIKQVSGDGTEASDYNFVTTADSYYVKKINSNLIVGDISVKVEDGISIEIPLTSMYTDTTYSIKLFSEKKYQFDLNLNVDEKNYNKGYPEVNSIIKFGIKVNNEDLGYINDLCGIYPNKTKIEIYGIKINEVTTTFENIKSIMINNENTKVRYKFQTINSKIQLSQSNPEITGGNHPYSPCRVLN